MRLIALLKKDLILELRTKETIAVMVLLSLLMAVILAAGVTNSFLTPGVISKLFPVFVWFIFVVTGAVALGRAHEYELHHEALSGLLLTGVPGALIFLSKAISGGLIILVAQLGSIIGLAVLLDVPLSSHLFALISITLLVTVGYSSLGTLFAALTSTSKLKGVLLPLVLLPLLFPLFFGAVELTFKVFESGILSPDSSWFTLLLGLDLLYVGFGLTLYEQVIRP